MPQNTIVVKNVEGAPDTQATVVHQNKIDYTPKVSVVIPIYNTEEYLRECLDTVVGQTLKEIEIICVDDGSTDSSLEIIKEYAAKDNRITIICQANLYAGVARNAGLAVAKGETIIWLDSDDYYKPEMLEKLYNKLIETNSDIAICQYKEINPTNEQVSKCDKINKKTTTFSKDTVKNIFTFFRVKPYNKLYSFNFIKNNNFKYSNSKISNDLAFSLTSRLLAKDISAVHEVLAAHRTISNASITKSRFKHMQEAPFVVEEIFNFLVNNNFLPKYKEAFITRITKLDYFYELNFPVDNDVLEKFKENLFASEHFPIIKKELIKKCNQALDNDLSPYNLTHNIQRLYDKEHFDYKKTTVLEKIFSIKNEYHTNNRIFKIIRILGLEIKIKNSQKMHVREQEYRLSMLEKRIATLEEQAKNK